MITDDIRFKDQNIRELSQKEIDLLLSVEIPESFSWSEISPSDQGEMLKTKHQIQQPQNQHSCGCCWAISIAQCMNDVYVINKKLLPDVSWTYMLINYPQKGCRGGNAAKLLLDVNANGVPSKRCRDYSWCDKSDLCKGGLLDMNTVLASFKKETCTKKGVYDMFSVDNMRKIYVGNLVLFKDVHRIIKAWIYLRGPVVVGIPLFQNFVNGSFARKGRLYIENKGRKRASKNTMVGGHTVCVMGWGTQDGIDFWHCRNSWGKEWGDNGFFKLAMYPTNTKCQFVRPMNLTEGWFGGALAFVAGDVKKKNIHQQKNDQKFLYLMLILLFFLFICV